MKPIEMVKQLQREFVHEYPGFGKRVGMKHICDYFGITRQALYKSSGNPNSKVNSINRKKRSNEKFLKFLINNYKTTGKSEQS